MRDLIERPPESRVTAPVHDGLGGNLSYARRRALGSVIDGSELDFEVDKCMESQLIIYVSYYVNQELESGMNAFPRLHPAGKDRAVQLPASALSSRTDIERHLPIWPYYALSSNRDLSLKLHNVHTTYF